MFEDRRDAGRRLAAHLTARPEHRGGRTDLVVLGLPRGGVPVAFEVARALRAPLDVLVVRKLGRPGHEEYAMGALGPGGVRVLNDDPRLRARVTDAAIEEVAARETRELARREALYRAGRSPLDLTGLEAVLVDDGLATGATMRAAALAARRLGAARVVVAVPVAPPDALEALRADADEVVSVLAPEPFFAVGPFYRDFAQTEDAEVLALLERAALPPSPL